eukprot:COSAG04_NODE_157_length_22270_cov_26.745298_17_plen_155_part_00
MVCLTALKAARTLSVFHNDILAAQDDGATWASPTPIPGKPGCPSCWIAPSFSAVQLKHHPQHKGDLVACLDYSDQPGHAGGGPVERSGTVISSDHGHSWFSGATGVLGDECAIAELANGTLVLNARNYIGQAQQVRSRLLLHTHTHRLRNNINT